MLQKFKITLYAIIIGLVLPSQAVAENATSCKGWNCSIEGQICPQGAPGASDASYICTNSKWVKMTDDPAQNPGEPSQSPVSAQTGTISQKQFNDIVNELKKETKSLQTLSDSLRSGITQIKIDKGKLVGATTQFNSKVAKIKAALTAEKARIVQLEGQLSEAKKLKGQLSEAKKSSAKWKAHSIRWYKTYVKTVKAARSTKAGMLQEWSDRFGVPAFRAAWIVGEGGWKARECEKYRGGARGGWAYRSRGKWICTRLLSSYRHATRTQIEAVHRCIRDPGACTGGITQTTRLDMTFPGTRSRVERFPCRGGVKLTTTQKRICTKP